jgi:hypothetical protein
MNFFGIMPMIVPREVELKRFSLVGSTLSADGLSADGRTSLVVLDARLLVGRSLPKQTLERLHLEKCRLDHLVRSGCLLFDGVERGSDPPDFRVNAGSTIVGLDISALALAERRLAYRLFDVFIAQIVASKATLANIVDTQVLVWFDLGCGLPPKRSDADVAADLVDCLRQVELDRGRMQRFYAETAAQGMPASFPSWYPIRWLSDNEAGFQISLLPSEAAPSSFRQAVGFECRLHMSMLIDAPFVMREIQRLVRKHDKPDIEWLLLTVGAPDTDGYVYPGEEVMYELIKDENERIGANHIRRLLLHRWSTGEFREFALESQGHRGPVETDCGS